MESMDRRPALYVITAATLYGVGLPLTKALLRDISPVAMAGLLYCGAFIGLGLYYALAHVAGGKAKGGDARLTRKDAPWLAGSILTGGFLAPILLMAGLNMATGFSASLLSNLEGVATAIIAVLVFRESTGRRLWLAMGCVTLGAVVLSWNGGEGRFELAGPVLIVLSMVCWGFDNNFTRQIANKDPMHIALAKSLVAGTVPILLILLLGGHIRLDITLAYALVVGAFGYGASLVLFILALKGIGASRTAALFGLAPFVGAVVSLAVLREWLGWVMLPAAALMALGAWLILAESHRHEHRHGPLEHSHAHTHDDGHHGHHTHPNGEDAGGPHVHVHAHSELAHEHDHYPDDHHRHEHD
jgi:drug/metabolite transporter (DMT)-like permease